VAANASALTAQQTLFKKTYAQALKGDEVKVQQAKIQLQGYRLNHYLDYALLKAEITSLPLAEIKAFQSKHPNSPLVKRLDDMLTYELGKQGQWKEYLSRYVNKQGSQKKHCWYLQARIATKDIKGLPQAITDTWMNGLSLPDACNSVFKWWEQQGHLTDKLIAQRIKLNFTVNNSSTARFLAAKMTQQPTWIKHAQQLMTDPLTALKKSLSWKDANETRDLVYIISKKMAQKKPMEMYQLWPQLKSHFAFTAKQISQVERTNALFAAVDYLPFTLKAINDLAPAQQDAQINAWKLRFQLNNGNWQGMIDTIKTMPVFQQNKDSWQYWLARAFAKTGNKKQAKSVFNKLAKQTSFYGFLAADHMRLPYEVCSNDIATEKITTMPENLLNAFELFAMDLISEARKEWIIGYRKLSIGQRRTLADVAMKKGWYNKVSAIMGALGLWNNYKMRFPLAYNTEITKLAKQHGLLPQWIMSIIKQESAWQTDAISRADARGLMQIIHPTAERLSKKLGLNYWGKPQLHDASFNLKLGIFYQRQLFDEFNNHPLLALASYNAGETKANDWLQGFSTSPDIWSETIPYLETRDYIKKILINNVIYDWLINTQPRRISSWMPTFPVDGKSMTGWPNSVTSQETTTVACSKGRP
jgi:soluble lytic murein transglycosylase